MLTMETIIKVRRLHRKHKLSIRQIAKQLNLNRRTVTKYLQQETLEPPQYQRTRKHYPVLQPYLNTLEQILQQQSRLPPQERQSAKQHYEHLRTLGYTGSYSAVCRFIALHKRQQPAQPTTAFIPLSFEPGEAYQFDWSTEVVKIGGELCKVQCAQFRLSYSRAAFIRCYFKQTTEMFIDAHNHAFTFFGGTTQHGIYDNLKTAVSKILSGKEREFTNSFQCMMDHFCIDPIACTPASGWEKGQIER